MAVCGNGGLVRTALLVDDGDDAGLGTIINSSYPICAECNVKKIYTALRKAKGARERETKGQEMVSSVFRGSAQVY